MAEVSSDTESDAGAPSDGAGLVGEMRTDNVAKVLQADRVAEEMLGYGPGGLVGQSSSEMLHPSDRDKTIMSWLRMLEEPDSPNINLVRYKAGDGSWVWIQAEHQNLLATHGYVVRTVKVASEQGAAVEALENQDLVLEGIADALPSGIVQLDNHMQPVFANDRWREMIGFDPTDGDSPNVGAGLMGLLDDVTGDQLKRVGLPEMYRTGSYDQDITVAPRHGSTEQRRWRLALRSLKNSEGIQVGLVACIDDITESWLLQKKLVVKAASDDLTGLANRAAIMDHLDNLLAQSSSTGATTAAIFIDLDGFKKVNDLLGHGVGDGLLQQIAGRVSAAVRPGDLVARLGGDEFLVACSDVVDAATSMVIARRVVDAISGKYQVNGHIVDMAASCGVAIDIGGKQTAERLISEADLAMYEQKRIGSKEPGFYKSSLFEAQRTELDREAALRNACHDGSFEVHYQPLVEVNSGETVAYEALLRWRFNGELLGPDVFIPIAERRGLIEDIGAWVLGEVVRQAAADPRRGIQWAVNVSPLQFRSGRFGQLVEETLTRYGLDASQLVLEITEGLLVTGDESKDQLLRTLVDLGVQLVVDDFGTGFASLDYLRTLPVHGLKIDRCFTADLDRPRTQIIVKNVVALAEALSMDIVVEGVETNEQVATLVSLGVNVCQGYLFARPAPYEELPGNFDPVVASEESDAN